MREDGRDGYREMVVAAEAFGVALDVADDGGERGAFLRRDQGRHAHGAGRERRDKRGCVRQRPFGVNERGGPLDETRRVERPQTIIGLVE